MTTWHIDFQDGWSGEPVVLSVDGEARYRGSPRTRTQIGLAESVTIETDRAAPELMLETPDTGEVGIEPAEDVAEQSEQWIGLSREADGTITVRRQSTPFGYL